MLAKPRLIGSWQPAPWPPPPCCAVLRCAALLQLYLHDHAPPIIHRDLKSPNLLVRVCSPPGRQNRACQAKPCMLCKGWRAPTPFEPCISAFLTGGQPLARQGVGFQLVQVSACWARHTLLLRGGASMLAVAISHLPCTVALRRMLEYLRHGMLTGPQASPVPPGNASPAQLARRPLPPNPQGVYSHYFAPALLLRQDPGRRSRAEQRPGHQPALAGARTAGGACCHAGFGRVQLCECKAPGTIRGYHNHQ